MSFPPSLLLVDDDEAFCRVLSRQLAQRGVATSVAHDAQAALLAATRLQPAGIVLDLKLGADNGLSLIAGLVACSPGSRIVLATGYASIATAVDAIRRGAHHYLPKPFSLADLAQAFADDSADPPPAAPPEAPATLRRQEWEHVQRVLSECQGNISAAARLLGVDRRTLQRRLAKRPVRERP